VSLERLRLALLVRGLRKAGSYPRYLEVVELGPMTACVALDERESALIEYNATTGFAATPAVAALKALTEYVERKAMHVAPFDLAKHGSDGFAAYPTVLLPKVLARTRARQRALAEALERCAWARWWDDEDVGAMVSTLSPPHGSDAHALLAVVTSTVPVDEVLVVRPKLGRIDGIELTILLARLRGGGYLSGGAAGRSSGETICRALSELLRHGLAAKRGRDAGLRHDAPGLTFYERRLLFFFEGEGDHLVDRRLERRAEHPVRGIGDEDLERDEVVAHRVDDLVVVHSCIFRDQPVFVGGELGRLCL
jgi:ribosomal protein S12 methylthiotransferase accessory factor YcaO